MSSTLVQGDKVSAHNTSHPVEPQHLEREDYDLLYKYTCDGLGKGDSLIESVTV